MGKIFARKLLKDYVRKLKVDKAQSSTNGGGAANTDLKLSYDEVADEFSELLPLLTFRAFSTYNGLITQIARTTC